MPEVNQLDTAVRKHHPSSPSSLAQSEACPAYLGENRESKASTDGVLLHKAVETRDLSILDGDEEKIALAEKCIAYEDALIAAHVEHWGKPPTVIREKYLSVGEDVVRASDGTVWKGVTGGFPDTLIVSPDGEFVDLPDWKTGHWLVEPTKNNPQGIAYYLGALDLVPTAKRVRVHFYGPRWGLTDEQQVEKYIHVFHRSERNIHELRIRTIIDRKKKAAAEVEKDDWSMAQPKTDLCLFCARRGACKKVQTLVIQTSEKHSDLVVPDEVKHYRLSRPEQVGAAYRFANQVISICEAIKKRAVEVSVTEDLKPEGFSIVKMAKRQVKSVKAVLDIAEQHGIPKDEALEMLTVPITSFEDAVKAKAVKGKGAAKVRAFAGELEECGATVLGSPFYFLRESRNPSNEKQQSVIEV